MTFNKEGSVLFCGLTSGVVAVLRSWDLERICSIDLPEYGSITCLKLIAGMRVEGCCHWLNKVLVQCLSGLTFLFFI